MVILHTHLRLTHARGKTNDIVIPSGDFHEQTDMIDHDKRQTDTMLPLNGPK